MTAEGPDTVFPPTPEPVEIEPENNGVSTDMALAHNFITLRAAIEAQGERLRFVEIACAVNFGAVLATLLVVIFGA